MTTPRAATAADAGAGTVTGARRALLTVWVVVFVDLLGFGVVIPVLPFYVRSFGVSDVFIGLLAASYSLMQFLSAPLLGRVSDERGRRPVLLLSVAGNAVAWTVFGLAGEVGVVAGATAALVTLFASRMLAGAMGGNVATAQAYVADVTAPENRAAALGLVGAAFGLGFIFGPAIGGFAASPDVVAAARSALPPWIPATRFSLPSFAAAGLSLSSLVLALAFLPEPARTADAGPRVSLVGQFLDALRSPDLRWLVVAFFFLSLAFSGVQVMFVPFAADVYGYGAPETALLLTYVGVVGVLNQGVLVGRLVRRYAERRLAVAGAALLAVALATLPFAPALGALLPALGGPAWFTRELLVLLAVLAVLSTGNGLLSVSLTALVSTSVGADRQGRAFGVTQGAGSLGRTAGPPAMAGLYVLATAAPFLAGALLVVPIVVLLRVTGAVRR